MMKFLNDNPNSFAKKLGYNRSQTIYDILSCKSAPSHDFYSKFLNSEYSELINIKWLISGNGNMLISKKYPAYEPNINMVCEEDIPHAKKSANEQEGIPLIPESAMAGTLNGEITVFDYECERYVIPVFKGADFLISVKGTSMYPKYSPGDIVACKRVSLSDLFFQWGKVYVLDTCQGALIKRINPGTEKDKIKIVSENKKYSPFELSISDIHSVALVIGVVRLE